MHKSFFFTTTIVWKVWFSFWLFYRLVFATPLCCAIFPQVRYKTYAYIIYSSFLKHMLYIFKYNNLLFIYQLMMAIGWRRNVLEFLLNIILNNKHKACINFIIYLIYLLCFHLVLVYILFIYFFICDKPFPRWFYSNFYTKVTSSFSFKFCI